MFYRKKGFPQEDDIVTCTVTNVQIHSVFLKLDEYELSGMMHISEVSPGRIRNLRDFVKEGRVVVCKVLKVNRERGQIDLSLRRVNEGQRREKIDDMRQEAKAEKIIENFAAKLKKPAEEIYKRIAVPIFGEFEYIYQAFESVVEENTMLSEFGVDEEISKSLTEFVKERIQPKEVELTGIISLTTYEPNGVELVKKAIAAGREKKPQANIKYESGGKFRVSVKAKEYKEAEAAIKELSDTIINFANKNNMQADFEKK
ncbi:MAG: S1 RNA-binding domain-containing protein [Candidatus Woesearchaeota archaeon]